MSELNQNTPQPQRRARLADIITSFTGNRKGTVAIIFGFAFVPVILFIGMAVDYARTQRIQTIMQNAVDSASIAAATASAPTTAQRVTIATNVFNANAQLDRFGLSSTPTVQVVPGEVTVTASVDVPTAFMKLASVNEVPLEVSSTVNTAGKTLELSMVLDVTGSMGNGSGSKLEDMKWGAKDLMDIVMPTGGTNSPTHIAVVPFSNRVNAGDYAPQVTGLAATRRVTSGWGWRRRTRTKYLYKCVTERQGSYRFKDDAPASGRYLGVYDPSSSTNSQYSSSQNNCSIPKVMPLSTDRTALRSHIDGFTAAGGTAGHIGTAWGMYTLSPKWNALWTDHTPRAYNDETNIKAVVIMTDGAYNTDYSSGYNSTQQALSLCEEMKKQDKKVVVYTIGFAIPVGSTQRQTLMSCATSASHYFFPYNGDDLRAAFASIGQALTYAQGSARITH